MADARQYPKIEPWQFDLKSPRQPSLDADRQFDTRALHSGFHPIEDTTNFRTFVPPIVQSATFPYESFDNRPTYVYSRNRNPTTNVLEDRLAALEGGEACVTSSSGSQMLFNLLLTMLHPGDSIVTSLHIFGEGYKQASTILPERLGVSCNFVANPADPEEWDRAIDSTTRLVWVETPSNPSLFVTDIAAVAAVAHSHGVPLLVDNTTATAALQKPIDLGADMVLLSITKFLSGNASVLGGALIGPRALIEDVRMNTIEFVGAVLAPFESWLTLQYLDSLSMRMERHSSNAVRVAEFLSGHPKVVRVNYPGLASHPRHELAKRQMKGCSGLLSFVVPDGMDGAARVMNNLKLITRAVTFGTSRTICMHPRTITHQHMAPEERLAAGIDDGMIRLSVGLEGIDDLITDLDQALSHL